MYLHRRAVGGPNRNLRASGTARFCWGPYLNHYQGFLSGSLASADIAANEFVN